MAKEGFLTERPILGAAGLQFIRRIPLIWTSYRPRRAQGYSRLQTSGLLSFSRAVCLAAQLAPTTGSSNGASLAGGPFIADGSFEVFVGRLVVAAFFKAFTKRFALALLGKVCCCCVSWSSVSPFSNRSSKRWVRLSLALRCSRSSALVGAPAAHFPL